MTQALLIIDVQNDYFPKGKMPLHEPEKALKTINQLEQRFEAKGLPVIYIQHVNPNPQAQFFVKGTAGADLHEDLKVSATSHVIKKQWPNAFLGTDLARTLAALNVTEVVVAGMMTHMCVDSTTRALREQGYQVTLIAEATATKALTFGDTQIPAEAVAAAFLASLTNFAQVVSITTSLNPK